MSANYMPQTMNLRSVKCAFGELGKKSVLAHQIKQLPQMVFMLLSVFRVDNEIVRICLSKVFDRGQNSVHEPLESGRGICQTKWKHLELIMIKGSSKGGLWAILRSDSDLMLYLA